jgi:predicted transcriptional regulator
MARRLTLSTAGIKSPLDLSQEREQTEDQVGRVERSQPRAPSQRQPRRRSTPASSYPRQPAPADAPFYGTGRPIQTSIALDPDCVARLEHLARDTGISTNALTVATLHAGLPAGDDDARAMIVDERVSRAGLRTARIERNLRLPEHLRARLDELTRTAQDRLPRATRADLVNAALRTGLPASAEQAAQLAISHARRVEQAATA